MVESRDECFELPRGGAIFGRFIGVIIIIVGLQQVFGLHINIGPFVTIMFGLLVLAGAIYGLSHRRSGDNFNLHSSYKISEKR